MKLKFKISKSRILGLIVGLAKYFRLLAVLSALTVLLILTFFLYKNLYLTITQSEQIILLKQEVAPDTIDMVKVNKTLEALEKKSTSTDEVNWSQIKNPFNFYVPSPSHGPTGID